MFALLALAGDIGCAIGPGIVGLVSNNKKIINIFNNIISNNDIMQIGLKAGIFFAVIFPIIMFITLIFFRRKEN